MSPATDSLKQDDITIQHSLDGFSYIIDNDKHTFVPAALYQESKKAQYLDFLGIKEENSVICADYIDLADTYNVYSIPKKEFDAIKSNSDKVECRHASSIILSDLLKENLERTDDPRIYLNIKNMCFDMIVLKGCNLLFYNYFRFKTKEDFLYFLLFSIEQLHLDAGSVPIYFIGMIEEDSQLVTITKRYVRDIRFKKDTK